LKSQIKNDKKQLISKEKEFEKITFEKDQLKNEIQTLKKEFEKQTKQTLIEFENEKLILSKRKADLELEKKENESKIDQLNQTLTSLTKTFEEEKSELINKMKKTVFDLETDLIQNKEQEIDRLKREFESELEKNESQINFKQFSTK